MSYDERIVYKKEEEGIEEWRETLAKYTINWVKTDPTEENIKQFRRKLVLTLFLCCYSFFIGGGICFSHIFACLITFPKIGRQTGEQRHNDQHHHRHHQYDDDYDMVEVKADTDAHADDDADDADSGIW